MSIPVLSDQDYENSRRITNLPASTANGEPVVHQQLAAVQATYTSTQTMNASGNITAWRSIVYVDCSAGQDITPTLPAADAAAVAGVSRITIVKIDGTLKADGTPTRVLPASAAGDNPLKTNASKDRVLRTQWEVLTFTARDVGEIVLTSNIGKPADIIFNLTAGGMWPTKNAHIRYDTTTAAIASQATGLAVADLGSTVTIVHAAGTNPLTLENNAGTIVNPLNLPLTSTTPGTSWDFKGIALNVWELLKITMAPSGGGVTNGDKGDITVTDSGNTWTIDNQAVTLAKIQDIATASFLGRASALAGSAEALTATQATALLDLVTATAKGLVTPPGTPTGRAFRDDLTWGAVSANATTKTLAQIKADAAGNAITPGAFYRITDEKALYVGSAVNDALIYYPNPLVERSRRLIVDNDFLIGATTNLGYFLGTTVGTGTISVAAGTVNNPGQVRFRSSTSANNGYRIGSDPGAIILKGGEKCLFHVNFFTTAGIQSRLGFLNVANAALAPDGAHFEVNAGVLSIRTTNNSVSTVGGTTLNVTQGTWYTLYIEVNSAGTSINFRVFNYTDGVQLYSQNLTTNLPIGTNRTTGFQVLSTTSAAVVTDLILIDYMGAEFYPARPSLQFA